MVRTKGNVVAGWCIEDEIKKLTGNLEIEVALQSCGLLEPSEKLREITVNQDWKRGGAETYVFEFSVFGMGGRERRVIAKAMTAPTPGTPPEQQLNMWIERRGTLVKNGSFAPELYAYGHGLLLEQYIPYDVADYVEKKGHIPFIYHGLVSCVASLVRSGFLPTTIIPNTRTDQTKVYWIDFGNDLGGCRALTPEDSEKVYAILFREYQVLTGYNVPLVGDRSINAHKQ